jgi:hypothetical protein
VFLVEKAQKMGMFGVLFSFYTPHQHHHHQRRSGYLARAMSKMGQRDGDGNGRMGKRGERNVLVQQHGSF